ncbi:PREDICTED: probable LRR receptor-like serine/threonine-protein kinase At1g53430 isoform X1 [Ipomoea nil]|uniref:probable LRR receptor-like serine/threonine-protein kinase At1g53430 isoform X1 n=2 Tax=Ipomoea nil TaxID=35883 RepID=UPI0009014781|nr:PREDICTED: probable LRR receptor-like serine/threonine-protein kinase At1g53430 isoform X1 [Ipomoea nil]
MEKVILLLLLFSLNSQLTMGEGTVTTTGPISNICYRTLNLGENQVKPLSTEDENAIIELIGCETSTYSRNGTNCDMRRSDRVICDCSLDKDVCRVTAIWFTYGWEGELPEVIGNLTNLFSLKLYGNKFSGEIPMSYANLKNLIHLDLEGNELEGPIPPFLGNMKLDFLDLSGNSFDGEIPTQLGSLVNLTFLDLSENSFSGSIPTQLGSLVNLKILDLSQNLFSGSIPIQLGSLTNLTSLDLSNNLFSDSIPIQLGSLVNLNYMYLYNNSFGGPIPIQLGSLVNLLYLDLSENLFNGSIPIQLGSLVNLTRLDLSDNLLSEAIPIEVGNLKSLMILDISDNQLSGPLPNQLGKLSLLRTLNVRGNNLTGRIPDSIGQLGNLTRLSLLGNNFEGPLTDQFSKLTNLVSLRVSDLVGGESQFPNLTNLSSLEYLTLRKCLLGGPIPPIIWNLPNLYSLDLSFNSLFGQIPKYVSSPPAYLFLRGNKLNGTIPKWIMNLTWHFDVSENFFTNNVAEIQNLHSNSSNLNLFSSLNSSEGGTHWEHVGYTCSDKKYLLEDHLFINCGGESMKINGSIYEGDLSLNGSSTFFLSRSLTWGYSSMGSYTSTKDEYIMNNTCIVGVGDVPLYSSARVSPISLKYYGFCLRNDEYTVKLHFAELVSNGNYKTPYINKSGRVFDVDIQGKNELKNFHIEKEAEGVNKAYTVEIENVIVNNSRLEIHLYWSGKGSMMYQGPLISAISVYPSKESDLSPPKMAAISLSVLILLIVLMVYFWKIEDNSHEGMVELYPGGLYNFHKVKAAANNFKDKLGEGGFGTFYEAKLGNGTAVAVEKVSATKDIIRAFREKDSTISLMEHPNLVKLMGCIAEKNQLLLVYEDIGRNSLQNALFGSNKLKLDWPTRRNICLGIAEGLAFLHECKQKNVHGNIKPTTIFLDKNLNAKIADFGFSRLHDQGKSLVDGTVVYLAPEYAKYDLLTTKADVYSFGVVVLIVVSGKKEKISMSSSGADTEYLPDLAAREKQREGHFMNLVDKTISNTVDWNQADTTLELALLCLDQYPDQRPSMSQVVKVLKEQLPLKDLKESLKQQSSVRETQPHGEISTTHHSKSRSTSRGGMTDTSVSASPSSTA